MKIAALGFVIALSAGCGGEQPPVAPAVPIGWSRHSTCIGCRDVAEDLKVCAGTARLRDVWVNLDAKVCGVLVNGYPLIVDCAPILAQSFADPIRHCFPETAG